MQRGIGRLRAGASAAPAPAPGYAIDAADFDGTNDYMTRGAALAGIADTKLLTFSFWVKKDVLGATQRGVFLVETAILSYLQLDYRSASSLFRVTALNAAGATILSVGSSAASNTAIWYHVMGSFDLSDVNKRHLYVNDVSDLAVVTTYTDDTMALTLGVDASIGARLLGTIGFVDGGLAQIAVKPGVYIDLSVEANRRKFISATGKPVDLGSDGSTAFGSAALVLQNLTDGAAPADFATNAGTGGNFTITGTLTTYPTSPSD